VSRIENRARRSHWNHWRGARKALAGGKQLTSNKASDFKDKPGEALIYARQAASQLFLLLLLGSPGCRCSDRPVAPPPPPPPDLATPGPDRAAPGAELFHLIPDLVYRRVGQRELLLDLYLPRQEPGPYRVVLFVHGGGWHSGNKQICPVHGLLARGLAAACFNYTLSTVAHFPAQLHDVKAAARWIRDEGARHRLNPARVGVWGMSAGAHLAAMLGTTGGVARLEGSSNAAVDGSRVQAVVAWYPPTDFLAMKEWERWPQYAEAVRLLLSLPNIASLDSAPRRATAASPLTYITADDPPFLIMHGAQDRVVPVEQSRLLHRALKKKGVDSTLEVLPEANHGGGFTLEHAAKVAEFFHKHL